MTSPACTPRHLLVDGSNVVQAWPETRKLARTNREAAKAQVLRRLARWHDQADLRVTVVFDGRGSELTIESVEGAATFACVHTPAGVTADEIIERLVAGAAEPAGCLVATADRAERASVEAAGAAVCDPAELAARLDALEARSDRAVALLKRSSEASWQAPRAAKK